MSSNVKNNIKRGVFWTAILAFGKQGLNLLATILLARLLCPDDYGLIGMIAIFISVSESIIDAGLGGALIKKKEVTAIDYATLNTYNLSVSVILYLLIFLLAPLVAHFYDKPILVSLLRLYSLTILIDAVAIVPKVKLSRELRFKELSVTTVLSGFVGLVSAVAMALMGYGVYSLIMQYVVSSLAGIIILFFYTRYLFSFGFSFVSFKELFTFGVNTTLSTTIKGFSENLFTNIIAKISPLNVTGYYNQSFKIQNVLLSMLQRITEGALFPVLCREKDKEVVRISMKLITFSFFLMTVMYFLLIINTRLIVLLLLGQNWLSVEVYLKLLLVVGLFQNFTALNRNMLKSLAKTFDILLTEIVALIFIGISLWILPTETNYILAVLAAYSLVRFVISVLFICKKRHLLGLRQYARQFAESFSIPLFSVLCALGSKCLLDSIILQNALFVVICWILSEYFKPEAYLELKSIALTRIKNITKK